MGRPAREALGALHFEYAAEQHWGILRQGRMWGRGGQIGQGIEQFRLRSGIGMVKEAAARSCLLSQA